MGTSVLNPQNLTAAQALQGLQEKNSVGNVAPVPKNITKWAKEHPILLCNVSPYAFRYEHPMVGVLTIPACPPGESYGFVSIPGMIPHGLRLEMKGVEIRHDDGRVFALDVLGLGYGQKPQEALLHTGVFIAANDTFNAKDAKEWVDEGECGAEPTPRELAQAHQRFLLWDQNLIAQGDKHYQEGPTQPTNRTMGHENITQQMRDACTRRKQNRPWNQEIQEMTECPGCRERIRPGMVVHTCGTVLDWDQAIALGIKKASDRPEPILLDEENSEPSKAKKGKKTV